MRLLYCVRRTPIYLYYGILIYNTVDEIYIKWIFILLENMWRFLSVNSELLTKTAAHTKNR